MSAQPGYVPFAGVSLASYAFFVERVTAGSNLAAALDGWKGLRRQGWDVTALLAPDGRSVVGVGVRYYELELEGGSAA